ncbi:divalent-cation tolerance protein CutA [Noviherbaspirillum cavernae]|uniref:Divalent-cation tolerance protein CutA n=1 Tax=Noviherbaspirillum cavernae TaxID=2320862 RepID=A0A418X4A4_9BURK|nr:divalent-cation tolerance protein CutA [Noviherbaspirillum cavernae]RJG07308.1 divalent-cation tolerance protein CutA [Noviherbaspirillum cavernae]
MQQAILVLTNVPDAAAARTIARELVELRLAACVNILPAVQSIYHWQGEVEEATEVTLLVKTVQSRYAALEAAIKAAHAYDVPEIIAVPIVGGLPRYLDWIVQETKKDVDV